MSKIIDPEKCEKVLDLPGICGRMFHRSEDLELVQLSIEPGKSIAGHEMPIDVIFYLLNGELEFIINEEKLCLKSNEVLEVGAMSTRAVKNNYAKTVKLLAIKKTKGKTGKTGRDKK